MTAVGLSLRKTEEKYSKHDDLRILDSRAVMDGGNLKYLLYHVAVKEDGSISDFWKAVRFTRIVRVPQDAKRQVQIMDIQKDVLTGLWHSGICTVTMISNSGPSHPELGVIFAYGTQSVGYSPGEAKYAADQDFGALVGTIEGSYAQIQHRSLTGEEASWVMSCTDNMRELLVVRGIPKPRESAVGQKDTFDLLRPEQELQDAEEQIEEVIRGLADVPYMMLVLGSPIQPKYISKWLRVVSDELSRYKSECQGQRSIGASVVFPIGMIGSLAENRGYATQQSRNEMYRTSQLQGMSEGRSWSDSQSVMSSFSESVSGSRTHNLGQSDSIAESINRGRTFQRGVSEGFGEQESVQQSRDYSESWGHRDGITESIGESTSDQTGYGTEYGKSDSVSTRVSHSDSSGGSWSNSSYTGEGSGESASDSMLVWSDKNKYDTLAERLLPNSLQQQEPYSVDKLWAYDDIVTGESIYDSVEHGVSPEATNVIDAPTTAERELQLEKLDQYVDEHYGNMPAESSELSTQQTVEIDGQKWKFTPDDWLAKEAPDYADIRYPNTYTESEEYHGIFNSNHYSSPLHGQDAETLNYYGNPFYKTDPNGNILNVDDRIMDVRSRHSNFDWLSDHGTIEQKTFTSSEVYSTTDSETNSWSAGCTAKLPTPAGSVGVDGSRSYSDMAGETSGESSSNSTNYTHTEVPGVTDSYMKTSSSGPSTSGSTTTTYGTSSEESAALGWKMGENTSFNSGQSYGRSAQYSENYGGGVGYGLSESMGYGKNTNLGSNVGENINDGRTIGQGFGTKDSFGTGFTDSTTEGRSSSYSEGGSAVDSASRSTSEGWGSGQSYSQQMSALSAMSSSISIIPAISYRESWDIYHEDRASVAKILSAFRDRLMGALQEGGHFSEVFMMTENVQDKHRAKAVLKSAFWGLDAFPTPIQVEEPDREESDHLLEHARVYSPCRKKNKKLTAIEPYRYSTFLTSNEMASYCHLPRAEAPGLSVSLEMMPRFRMPLPGKIEKGYYLGNIINTERLEHTSIPYVIPPNRLGHCLISGLSGSGKTTAALRLAYEMVTKPPHMKVLVLDWKRSYRSLYSCLGEKVKVYSLSRTDLNPLGFNPCAVPKKVDPFIWLNTIAECFSLGMGLGVRAYSIIWEHLDMLYRKHEVYAHPERSREIDMTDLQKKVMESIDNLPKFKKKFGAMTRDRLNVVANRLFYFREDSEISKIFSKHGCRSIDEILNEGQVLVMEAGNMDAVVKKFALSILAAGVFAHVQARGKPFNPPLALLWEEAHEVIVGVDDGISSALGIKQSIFETIYTESRKHGIVNIACVQNPSELPEAVLTCSPTLIALRVDSEKDQRMLTLKVGREPKYDDEGREIFRFISKQPRGWCIARMGYCGAVLDAEPSAVYVSMLPVKAPNDEEIYRYNWNDLQGDDF